MRPSDADRAHIQIDAGDALSAFTDAGWITRAPQHRAVRITPAGESALRSRLGLDL